MAISFESGEDVELTNIQTFQPGFNKLLYETHGFSPDDSQIIFSGSLEPDQITGYMDIYTMDIDASETSLKNLTNTPFDQWDEHAHYSPDGKRIVWIRSVNDFDPDDWRETMKTEYFMMDANGEDKKQITFFNNPDHSHYEIFGGKRVIVADSAWSPDGLSIMASIAVDGNPYIVMIEGL